MKTTGSHLRMCRTQLLTRIDNKTYVRIFPRRHFIYPLLYIKTVGPVDRETHSAQQNNTFSGHSGILDKIEQMTESNGQLKLLRVKTFPDERANPASQRVELLLTAIKIIGFVTYCQSGFQHTATRLEHPGR